LFAVALKSKAEMTTSRRIVGDCRDVLRQLIADGVKVQCCITSPPYFGLRDYGTGTWKGGDEECDHRSPTMREGRNEERPVLGGSVATNSAQLLLAHRSSCGKCGARKVDKQIGLEATVEEYIETLVGVFGLVREVLAADGVMFVNMGDGYATGTNADRNPTSTQGSEVPSSWSNRSSPVRHHPKTLKPKDLIGMPWRLAFALQSDGWYLRSDCIWSKPNPMPESVQGSQMKRHMVSIDALDEKVECPGCERCEPYGGYIPFLGAGRPTKSHEYLFMLSKSARYFWDAVAIREKCSYNSHGGPNIVPGEKNAALGKADPSNRLGKWTDEDKENGRNRRTVWTIPTEAFPAAHFATFARKLVEPCILSGTSTRGHCPQCGKRWMRVKDAIDWRPSCQCCFGETSSGMHYNPAPDIILDPFAGSGTVGLVASQLGRESILIELSEEYSKLAREDFPQSVMTL
jgi:DNA modification methylase